MFKKLLYLLLILAIGYTHLYGYSVWSTALIGYSIGLDCFIIFWVGDKLIGIIHQDTIRKSKDYERIKKNTNRFILSVQNNKTYKSYIEDTLWYIGIAYLGLITNNLVLVLINIILAMIIDRIEKYLLNSVGIK